MLDKALAIARLAAKVVMRVYDAREYVVEFKAKNDPVTVADREANALIVAELEAAFPGIPIVAEESDPSSFAGHETAAATWFVDPLDGTREFIARNGEFAVMIGLAERGRATLGAVVCPALRRAFIGALGVGAFEVREDDARVPIRVSSVSKLGDASALVSRSHRNKEIDLVLAKLGCKSLTPYGSAGVKAARVACGEFDLYAQPGPTGMRWDSCGPEAIVRAAGGVMTNADGTPFDYSTRDLSNRRGVIAANPTLHAAAVAAFEPHMSS